MSAETRYWLLRTGSVAAIRFFIPAVGLRDTPVRRMR